MNERDLGSIAFILHSYVCDPATFRPINERANIALRQKGWLRITDPIRSATATTPLYVIFRGSESWLGLGALNEFEFVSEETVPTPLTVLHDMYSAGAKRAAIEDVIRMFSSLSLFASRGRYADIMTIMAEADMTQLAPELLIGLVRITFPNRDDLSPIWQATVQNVRRELKRRKFANVKQVMAGLL